MPTAFDEISQLYYIFKPHADLNYCIIQILIDMINRSFLVLNACQSNYNSNECLGLK